MKLNLDAQNFNYFICDKPEITISVDIDCLHDALSTMNEDNPILMYIIKRNRGLYVKGINKRSKRIKTAKLQLKNSVRKNNFFEASNFTSFTCKTQLKMIKTMYRFISFFVAVSDILTPKTILASFMDVLFQHEITVASDKIYEICKNLEKGSMKKMNTNNIRIHFFEL
jgi:hypothetical protein